MVVSRLDSGALSCGLAPRRNCFNRKTKLIPTVKSSREWSSFLRKPLKNADEMSRYHLSTDHRVFFSPLSMHRRNSHLHVSRYQSNSDLGVESSEVEGKNVPEEEGDTAFPNNEAIESRGKQNSSGVKRELIQLTLPAIGGQAIEPLAQLMETAYIGRLGPVELGSAGISMAIFNNISKLFNIPLLSVATSFVAEDFSRKSMNDSVNGGLLAEIGNGSPSAGAAKRLELPSVSTALLLAMGIGIIEAVSLFFGSGVFLNLMGISSASSMHATAQRFLSLRAIGAPAVVMSLALQGIFRGLKDTKTPVLCLGIGNVAAVILFPVLIHYFHLGVTGAALSSVVSQYIVTFTMLLYLKERVVLLPPKMGQMQFGGYVKSGGFLLGRTLSVLVTMTIATSMAARQGPMAMAAHQICLQVWLAVSMLSDALAAAGQAVIASSFSKGEYKVVREATTFVLMIGTLAGIFMAAVIGVSFGSIASLFTKDAEVLAIAKTGVLFVSATQPINALAFIFDGLHYGVSDFPYAASSMMLVGALSSAVLLYAPRHLGLPGVWSGLTIFMALRMLSGVFRLLSKNSPWWFLHGDNKRTQAPFHNVQ